MGCGVSISWTAAELKSPKRAQKKKEVLCVSKHIRSFLVIACLTSLTAAAAANTISIVSGNVPMGQRDPLITVRGAEVTIGSKTATAADEPLQQALVMTDPHSVWTQPPPGSRWISVEPYRYYSADDRRPGGYIYETSFELPETCLDPSISVTASADDAGAIYLNGHLLGTGLRYDMLLTFASENPEWFQAGSNVLQFQLQNLYWVPPIVGTNTGVTFSAEVTYTPVPEPSCLLMLGFGLGSYAGFRRLRRIR